MFGYVRYLSYLCIVEKEVFMDRETKTLRNGSQLIDVISSLKGGALVSLTSLTDVHINDFRIHGRVLKWCKQTMQVGVKYERAVNTRLHRIGIWNCFKSSSLPYGTWVIPNRILKYEGRTYARFYPVQNSDRKVCYFIDGRIATARESEIIAAFEQYAKPCSHKQAFFGLQEKQVGVRNYRIEHILEMSAEGTRYVIEFSRKMSSVAR